MEGDEGAEVSLVDEIGEHSAKLILLLESGVKDCLGVADLWSTDKFVCVLLSDLFDFCTEVVGVDVDIVGFTTLTDGLCRLKLGLIIGLWGRVCFIDLPEDEAFAGCVSILTAGMVTGT